MNIKKFVKERDEALKSLNKAKILKFISDWKLCIPQSLFEDDIGFWCMIHKARLGITSLTEKEVQFSTDWLISHGFNPEWR